jgi:hypothetical protein
MNSGFFNLNPHQTVNQWLCIILISAWCFGMVLYWFSEKAKILETQINAQQIALQGVVSSK